MMGRTKSRLMEKTRFLLAIPLMGLLMAVFSCEPLEDPELVSEADISMEQHFKAISEEIYHVEGDVENMPKPSGGLEGWNQYLSKNLTYPSLARERGIEGTVYVAFVVNADGSIRDTEILKGIGGGCDEEAMNTIKNSPKWTPGTKGDQKVNVRIRVPIKFVLGK